MVNTRFDSKDKITNEVVQYLALKTNSLPIYYNKTLINNEPVPGETNNCYSYILIDEVASKVYLCVIVNKEKKSVELT